MPRLPDLINPEMVRVFEALATGTLCFAAGFGVSWPLTAGLIRLAPRLGLIDRPDPRKVHTQPTPRGGGLAIYAALGVGSAAAALVRERAFDGLPLLLGLAVVLLGLLDDWWPLPWQLRLAVQAGAAAVAVLLGVPGLTGWLVPLAVVWVVGLTNAFNMLDNMDALSAGVAWVIAAGLAVTTVWTGNDPLPFVILMGGLTGFLWYNRPPARIFMGDAGSTFLGFFLGLGGVRAVLAPTAPATAWLGLPLLFAVPWYDLTSVVLLRLSQGRSPFQADRQHLSHRLVGRGLRPARAVAVIHALALVSVASGLLLYAVAAWAPALVFAGLLAVWWVPLARSEWS